MNPILSYLSYLSPGPGDALNFTATVRFRLGAPKLTLLKENLKIYGGRIDQVVAAVDALFILVVVVFDKIY